MQRHELITDTLRSVRQSGRVPLVAFLTAGYPRVDRFGDDLREVCAHADIVEIGVPFTDPMADGVTIQRSSEAALAAGVSLSWILEQLRDMESRPETPLLLMSYLNPLLAYGLDRLADDAAAAGVSGFIVPDLPFDESGDFRVSMQREGLALVQLVTPITPDERLRQVCDASSGFVYAVTVAGITGGAKALPGGMHDYLERVRAVSAIPVCAGFGIRSAQQVSAIGEHADGVIVGSALVETMERGEPAGAFLDSLRPAS
jgi:tryptophan synthase alpha chain